MRSNAATVTSQLQADDLKKALRGLPPKLQQAILKKSLRKAAKPIQDQLKSAWASAPYKGRPPHRQAIVRNTVIDVRRAGGGFSAPIVARVGVDYKGRKGMLQRVWHLLEGGFKRYAKGSKGAYQNLSKIAHDEKQAYKAFIHGARSRVMKSKKLSSKERGQLFREIAAEGRRQFPNYVAERTQRASLRSRSVAARNASMPGAWRSKAIVKSMLPAALQSFRAEALKAARMALRGENP